MNVIPFVRAKLLSFPPYSSLLSIPDYSNRVSFALTPCGGHHFDTQRDRDIDPDVNSVYLSGASLAGADAFHIAHG